MNLSNLTRSMKMTINETELGLKCCNEFLCGECPYEIYDDKENGTYIMRCIHKLIQDVSKLYFNKTNED